jgi:hypothetical protein
MKLFKCFCDSVQGHRELLDLRSNTMFRSENHHLLRRMGMSAGRAHNLIPPCEKRYNRNWPWFISQSEWKYLGEWVEYASISVACKISKIVFFSPSRFLMFSFFILSDHSIDQSIISLNVTDDQKKRERERV